MLTSSNAEPINMTLVVKSIRIREAARELDARTTIVATDHSKADHARLEEFGADLRRAGRVDRRAAWMDPKRAVRSRALAVREARAVLRPSAKFVPSIPVSGPASSAAC